MWDNFINPIIRFIGALQNLTFIVTSTRPVELSSNLQGSGKYGDLLL